MNSKNRSVIAIRGFSLPLPQSLVGQGKADERTEAISVNGKPALQAFSAKAKQFAEANNITNPTAAQIAFASTPEGNELYRQYRRELLFRKSS